MAGLPGKAAAAGMQRFLNPKPQDWWCNSKEMLSVSQPTLPVIWPVHKGCKAAAER
jgi:hypothetical protein